MKSICLIFTFFLSVIAAHATDLASLGIYSPYRYGYFSRSYGPVYYNNYLYPYVPYQPDNGPMRGPNSIQGHMQQQPNYNPYGAYPFTPYEPDNGPMRGPNSIQGRMRYY